MAEVLERNSALSAANGELRRKVVELEDASEECASLKGRLVRAESECTTARWVDRTQLRIQ